MGAERPDWLARNGGWVLLVFGALLVAVSVVIADRQAVASILAGAGVAAAVFGVILSRLEGSFEFSLTKVAATLKAARTVGVREDLTQEERAELIFRLLGIAGDKQAQPTPAASESSTGDSRSQQQAGDTGTTRASPRLPRPVPFRVVGATQNTHAVFRGFEEHVASVFRRAGWEVDVVGPQNRAFDLVVHKDDWHLYIEIKLGRRLSMADADRFVSMVGGRPAAPMTRYVFAVNAGALSAAARDVLASSPSILLWEIPVEGW